MQSYQRGRVRNLATAVLSAVSEFFIDNNKPDM